MSHAERAHAILSPSFLHIALHCSGSVGLKEKLPPAPTSQAAALGTKTHEVAEAYLSELLEYRSTGNTSGYATVVKSEAEAKKVHEAAEGWCNTIWKECFEESITGKAWALEDRKTFYVEI